MLPQKVPQISRFDEFENVLPINNLVDFDYVPSSNFLDFQDVLWIRRWSQNKYTPILVKLHSQTKIDSNFSLSPSERRYQMELFWKSFSQIRKHLKTFFAKTDCSQRNYPKGIIPKLNFGGAFLMATCKGVETESPWIVRVSRWLI